MQGFRVERCEDALGEAERPSREYRRLAYTRMRVACRQLAAHAPALQPTRTHARMHACTHTHTRETRGQRTRGQEDKGTRDEAR